MRCSVGENSHKQGLKHPHSKSEYAKTNGCSSLTAHLVRVSCFIIQDDLPVQTKAVSGRASNAYNRQAHSCVKVLWYMSEFGPGQVRASEEQV